MSLQSRHSANKLIALFAPVSIAVCCSAVLIYVFYPGFMSYDSLYQWRQVKGEMPLHDGFPLIMVYTWRLLAAVHDNPGTLLVFHQCVHWTAIVMFSYAISDRAATRVGVVLLIGLCPPLLIHSIHLWKDEGMVAAYSLAVAALLLHGKMPRIWLLAVAVLGLFYGTAVRHNAVTALLVLTPLFGVAVARQVSFHADKFHADKLRWSLRNPDRRIVTAVLASIAVFVTVP
jgi:hypothetical protein